MPAVRVVLYREDDGTCPFIEWMTSLPDKAKDKCVVKIGRLAELGHELRRPEADYLRDGIHELRTHQGHVQFRLLYFFHGREAVVLSHGVTKEQAVSDDEINRGVQRKVKFLRDPSRHTCEEEI